MYTWHTLPHYPHGANAGCDLAGVAPVVSLSFEQRKYIQQFQIYITCLAVRPPAQLYLYDNTPQAHKAEG